MARVPKKFSKNLLTLTNFYLYFSYMNYKPIRHNKTIVEYTKNDQLYRHTFSGVLGKTQILQRMLMEVHVAPSAIGQHYYE